MRLRNIPGATEYIQNSIFCINEPEKLKGNWSQELFNNQNPIHIEIGMGKGQFITNLAKQNPNINYIGIEKYSSVLIKAVNKIENEPLDNLRFLCFNAENITSIFNKEEINKIFLNFSDPWPKDRHAKRRLTSPEYLEKYSNIIIKSGSIEFKTDNRILFDYSVESINKSKLFNISEISYDLHHDSSMNVGNIMTEYEEKFSSMGNPIYKLIAKNTNV